jgi:hypothetical protein
VNASDPRNSADTHSLSEKRNDFGGLFCRTYLINPPRRVVLDASGAKARFLLAF